MSKKKSEKLSKTEAAELVIKAVTAIAALITAVANIFK